MFNQERGHIHLRFIFGYSSPSELRFVQKLFTVWKKSTRQMSERPNGYL